MLYYTRRPQIIQASKAMANQILFRLTMGSEELFGLTAIRSCRSVSQSSRTGSSMAMTTY